MKVSLGNGTDLRLIHWCGGYGWETGSPEPEEWMWRRAGVWLSEEAFHSVASWKDLVPYLCTNSRQSLLNCSWRDFTLYLKHDEQRTDWRIPLWLSVWLSLAKGLTILEHQFQCCVWTVCFFYSNLKEVSGLKGRLFLYPRCPLELN